MLMTELSLRVIFEVVASTSPKTGQGFKVSLQKVYAIMATTLLCCFW